MVRTKNFRNVLWVALLCLSLALGVWYWTETRIQFYLSGSKNEVEKIGQVKQINFNTLLNFSGQLIWQKMEEGDFIFVGNSIQTNQDSSTEIILDDGQQILIGKNSLVRFVKEDGAISLHLEEGKIEVKDAKADGLLEAQKKPFEFYVKTPNGKINTKSSNIKIEKKSKTDYIYEVLSGKPKILNKSFEPLDIVSKKVDIDLSVKARNEEISLVEAPKPVEKPAVVEAEPAAALMNVQAPPPVTAVETFAPTPKEPVKPTMRKLAQAPKKKFLKLPEKIPLAAPKIKRVDVKVVD